MAFNPFEPSEQDKEFNPFEEPEEKEWRYPKAFYNGAIAQGGRGLFGVLQMAEDELVRRVTMSQSEENPEVPFKPSSSTNAYRDYADDAKWLQDYNVKGHSTIDQFGLDLTSGAGQLVRQMGTAALTGGVGGTASMFGDIAGSQYLDLTNDGVAQDIARNAALANYAVQAPLEYVGISSIMNKVPKGTPAWNRGVAYAERFLKEGGTEGVQTFPEQLSDIYAHNPNSSASEMASKWKENAGDNLKEATYSGLVGGILGVGGGIAVDALSGENYKGDGTKASPQNNEPSNNGFDPFVENPKPNSSGAALGEDNIIDAEIVRDENPGASSSVVDRVRNLIGKIPYVAEDGTNCMRTMGIALQGTPFEGQINVDQAIATAKENGLLKDPGNYTPKPGDMAVVNDGNHIVMVTENGGTIQNGQSKNGVYEDGSSPEAMFGGVKYYIQSSVYNNGNSVNQDASNIQGDEFANMADFLTGNQYTYDAETNNAIAEALEHQDYDKMAAIFKTLPDSGKYKPTDTDVSTGQQNANTSDPAQSYNGENSGIPLLQTRFGNLVNKVKAGKGSKATLIPQNNITVGRSALETKLRDTTLVAMSKRAFNGDKQAMQRFKALRPDVQETLKRIIDKSDNSGLNPIELPAPNAVLGIKKESTTNGWLQTEMAKAQDEVASMQANGGTVNKDMINKAVNSPLAIELTKNAIDGNPDSQRNFNTMRADVRQALLNKVAPQTVANPVIDNTGTSTGNADSKKSLIDSIVAGNAENPSTEWKRLIKLTQEGISSLIDPLVDKMKAEGKQGVAIVQGEKGRGTRSSNNPKWYRNLYAKLGRSPKDADYKRYAYDVLTNLDAAQEFFEFAHDGSKELENELIANKQVLDGLFDYGAALKNVKDDVFALDKNIAKDTKKEKTAAAKKATKASEEVVPSLADGYKTESGRSLQESDSKEFIIKPDGSKDFGEIGEAVAHKTNGRLKNAPIRLQVGDSRFGIRHLFKHLSQIKDKGFNDPLSFIDYIINNFTQIYDQSDEVKSNRFVLYVQDKSKGFMPLDLELESNGNQYYTVVSAMPHNEKIKGTLIYDGSARPSAATTNGSLSVDSNNKGGVTSTIVHANKSVPIMENVSQNATNVNTPDQSDKDTRFNKDRAVNSLDSLIGRKQKEESIEKKLVNIVDESELDAELANIKGKLDRLSANPMFDPDLMKSLTKVGMIYLQKGVNKFGAWSEKMVTAAGEKIRPFLRSIWSTLNAYPDNVKFNDEIMTAVMEYVGSGVDEGKGLDQIKSEFSDAYGDDYVGYVDAAYAGIKDYPINGAENVIESKKKEDGGSDVHGGTGELAKRDSERADKNAVGSDDGSKQSGGTGGRGVLSPEREGRSQGGGRVHGRGATVGRTRGDNVVRNGKEPGDTDGRAGSAGREGSGDAGEHGTKQYADGRADKDARISTVDRRNNDSSESREIKVTSEKSRSDFDNDSIRKVKKEMPHLLDGQVQDVVFAEKRLFENAQTGVLFTNGTGTGKTFTGLGVIARQVAQGKKNILVVTPNQKINTAWVDADAEHFKLGLKELKNTKDAGEGVVITTFANFGDNKAIIHRNWDMIVVDESQNLLNNEKGENTLALRMLRALTMHKQGARDRFMKLHETDAIRDMQKEISKLGSSPANEAKVNELHRKINEHYAGLDDKRKEIEDQVNQTNTANKPKTVFLSATPFAYVKNIDYANGYLFDYPAESQGGYNSAGGRERFLMDHFGYRMRYNKLTMPDSKVDSRINEVKFHEWLKEQGALSSRVLEIDHDYDRGFLVVDGGIGSKIDEGFEWLSKKENGEYKELRDALYKQFDGRTRNYVLESLKARGAIGIIKDYLAAGKKVVLFHDSKKPRTAFHPFRLSNISVNTQRADEAAYVAYKAKEQYERFKMARPDLVALNLDDLKSPINTLQEAFADDLLLFNGDVPSAVRNKNVDEFNRDDSGKNIILVQSQAGNAGISMHDTTGKHQRVLINLGIPRRPIYATQIEGRIYRVGNKSNAIFRYLSTGTNMEKHLFATTIAERASTAENLAMGNMARNLRQSFIDGFTATLDGSWIDNLPGSENEGLGGKEKDRNTAAALTEYDYAKTLYYGQQKKNSKNKAAEGNDYFATPEPVGFKMVEWARLQDGEKVLEPSAGHGAISRFFSPNQDITIIEPSSSLAPLAQLATDNGKLIQGMFENHNIVNKYDAIVMNPPFGTAGKIAMEHVAKAFQHLKMNGRVIAIVPNGPSMNKRLDNWLDSDASKNSNVVARIKLPACTFERAGTKVNCEILVIDKINAKEAESWAVHRNIDLSGAENVEELFSRLENIAMPERGSNGAHVSSAKTEAEPSISRRSNVSIEVSEHNNTKTGDVQYKAKMDKAVSNDTYSAINGIAKKNQGYYSRFVRGFLFNSQENANSFKEQGERYLDERESASYSIRDTASGKELTTNELLKIAKQSVPTGRNFKVADNTVSFDLPNGSRLYIDLVEEILATPEQLAKASADHGKAVTSNKQLQGSMRVVGIDGFMQLTKDSEDGTIDHEIMELAQKLALNTTEKQALNKAIPNKEKQCDEYREWQKLRLQGKGSRFGKLWQKIQNLADQVKALCGSVEAKRKIEMEQVFERVASGEVWNRDVDGNPVLGADRLRNDTARWGKLCDVYNADKAAWDRKNSGALFDFMNMPQVLQLIGAKDLKLQVYGSFFSHAIRADHPGMDINVLKQLPPKVADPLMIFKTQNPNKFVLTLALVDNNKATVVVPVELEKLDARHGVIRVVNSAYGRVSIIDNKTPNYDWFEKNLSKGNLVYANKKKSTDWVQAIRKEFPVGFTLLNRALLNPSIKNEEDLVKLKLQYPEKYSVNSNVDPNTDTDLEFKAPNGKRSNLNEKQWLAVRTDAFKNWFGDWEAKAVQKYLIESKPIQIADNELIGITGKELTQKSIEIYRHLFQKDGKPISITNKYGEDIIMPMRSIKKVATHSADNRVLTITPNLEEIIKNATLVFTDNSLKNKVGVKGFKYYATKATINGEDVIIKLVIREEYSGKLYYDNDVTTLETLQALKKDETSKATVPATKAGGSFDESSFLKHSISEWWSKVNNTDVSKAVDENGEPIVTYHGTNANEKFSSFDTYGSNFGLFGQGAYFTENEQVAKEYQSKGKGSNPRTYNVFLKITNPLDMDSKANVEAWKNASHEMDIRPDFRDVVTNEDAYRAVLEYLEYEQYTKSEALDIMYDFAYQMGYDGVTHIGGGRFKNSDIKHRVWIAFEPSQIKSVDNVGSFNKDSSDIYYSVREAVDNLTDNLKDMTGNKQDERIEVREAKRNPDSKFGFLDSLIRSPGYLAEKYPKFKLFFKLADTAMQKQEELRSMFDRKLKRINDHMKNDSERSQWQEALLEGDAIGKEFTVSELKERGLADNVIRAYVQTRMAIKNAYDMLNDARKQMQTHQKNMSTADLENLRKNKFAKIVKVDKTDGDNYIVVYKSPKVWTKKTVMDETMLKELQQRENVQMDKIVRNADDTYEVTYRESVGDLANKTGYIPRFFHDFFVMTKEDSGKVDAEGNAIYNYVTVGSGRTIKDAYSKAEKYLADNPSANIVIQPKQFSFDADEGARAAIVGDIEYENMVKRISKDMEMSIGEAKEFMRGKIKMGSKHRFFGNFMKRKGAKGFEENMNWLLKHYFNATGRYIALEEFKPAAKGLFERYYGRFDNDYSDQPLAHYTKQFINDMNGNPSVVETMVNNFLNQSGWYRKYVASNFGDRAALQLANSITGKISILKLGFLNVSSALLNLSQLINTIGLVGEFSPVGIGMKRAVNPTISDMKIFKETGILNDISMDTTSGYSKFKPGNVAAKSMYLFRKMDMYARKATVLAAYHKAMRDGKKHAEAIAYAKEVNRKANFDYGVADAPNVFRRGSIFSQIALQFKKYPIKEMELMYELVTKGTAKQNAKFWGTYFLVCGLLQFPAADWFDDIWQELFGDSPKKKIQKFIIDAAGGDPMGKELAKVAMYGIMAASPINIDMSRRAGMGDISLSIDNGLTGLLGGATASTVKQTLQGLPALFNGDILPTVKALSPALGNYMQAVSGHTEGRRGRTNSRLDNTYDAVLKAAGFRNVNESITSDAQQIVNSGKSERSKARQAIMDRVLTKQANKEQLSRDDIAELKKLGVTGQQLNNERMKKRMDAQGRLRSSLSDKDAVRYKELLKFVK